MMNTNEGQEGGAETVSEIIIQKGDIYILVHTPDESHVWPVAQQVVPQRTLGLKAV